MSPTLVTPSEDVTSVVVRSVATGPYDARYQESELHHYLVRIPSPAPPALRVALTFGQEPNGVWAHIEEFDISAEGADIGEAFRNVLDAARDWLAYIREEGPGLGPDIASQRRYVPLLDAPVFSWFRAFRFAD